MDAMSAIESSVLFKRYIYICHPHMAKLYCKMKTISKFGKLILTLAILHNVPRVFDREYIILDFGKTFSTPPLFIQNFKLQRGKL